MCEEIKTPHWRQQHSTQLINSTSSISFHFVTSTSSSFPEHFLRLLKSKVISFFPLLGDKLSELTWKPCCRHNNNSCGEDIAPRHPVSVISFSMGAGCECLSRSVITFQSAFLTKKTLDRNSEEAQATGDCDVKGFIEVKYKSKGWM